MYNAANSLRYCRACHRATAAVLDHTSGNTVCSDCALPLGERYVDVSSGWRSFAARADDRSRDDVGGAAAHHFPAHGQLGTGGTTIACSAPAPHKVQANASADTDADPAEGAGVMPVMRSAAGARAGVAPRMRGAVGPTPEKALVEATHAIDDMAERLALPEAVKDRAKELFKKLEEAKAFPKGGKCRNRGALCAACLQTACRAEGVPRTFKELASVAGDGATGGMRDIGRLVKHIKKLLGEEAAGPASHTGAVVQAGDYLLRFGALLGMNNQEVQAAQEAAQRLVDALDVRRNPDSIAAGIIYMAIHRAGGSKSMRDVSTVTGVSEVTIREVYHRDLCPHAELLFG